MEITWASTDWAHPAVEVRDGLLWVTHPNGHTLEAYDGETLVDRVDTDLLELHYLRWPWAVDTGSKRFVDGGSFETVRTRGRVVRLTDGFALADPYPDLKYSPTAVAIDGDGGLWVADGYGQMVVHRFTPDGELEHTIDDGFATPHSVAVVGDALLVCDRANGRIREYDLDGTPRRTLAEGVVVTPTDLVAVGESLVVTDLHAARVSVLTRDGELVEHLCAGPRSHEEDAWPNTRDDRGDIVRPDLRPGALNSPHTIAAGPRGELFVTEWVIGGRVANVRAWISA